MSGPVFVALCLFAGVAACSASGGPGASSHNGMAAMDTSSESDAVAALPGSVSPKPSGDSRASEGGDLGGLAGAASVDDKPLAGSLTQDDIRSVVERNGALFNDCYTIGAGKSQQFEGKVTLKVTLGPTGKVNEVRVTGSTTKNPSVDRCVVDGFKKIQFPSPKDGATTVFSFPMEFKGAIEVRH